MPPANDRPAAKRNFGLWRGGQLDDEEFLRSHRNLSAAELAAVLRVDLRQRFSLGERLLVEAYLARFPALRQDAGAVLDLIYSEFLLCDAAGESPTDEEYAARFPEYAETLSAQFALHRLAHLPMTPAPTIELSPSAFAVLVETQVDRQTSNVSRATDGKSASGKPAFKRRRIASIFIAVGVVAAIFLGLVIYANRPQESTSDPASPIDLASEEWLAALPAGWSRVEGALESDGNVTIDNLKLKAVKAPRYRVECEFSAKNAHDAIYFMLPVGQRQCFFGVNAFPDGATDTSVSGFGEIDGKNLSVNATGVRRRKLKQGERHRLTIDVSLHGERANLSAALDELPPFTWNGPVASLAVPYTYRWPERQTFGLGTVQASYRVYSLVYRELPEESRSNTISPSGKRSAASLNE